MRGQKQEDKSSPLLFGLVFNALLLGLEATGVGTTLSCRASGPQPAGSQTMWQLCKLNW